LAFHMTTSLQVSSPKFCTLFLLCMLHILHISKQYYQKNAVYIISSMSLRLKYLHNTSCGLRCLRWSVAWFILNYGASQNPESHALLQRVTVWSAVLVRCTLSWGCGTSVWTVCATTCARRVSSWAGLARGTSWDTQCRNIVMRQVWHMFTSSTC
jgi:hypothetical protein